MSWIGTLLGRPARPRTPPLLVRVRAPGGALPNEVQLSAQWFPSERRTALTQRPALGLCVVPWFPDETRVELTIESADGVAKLVVRRDRDDPDRAINLQLEATRASLAV